MRYVWFQQEIFKLVFFLPPFFYLRAYYATRSVNQKPANKKRKQCILRYAIGKQKPPNKKRKQCVLRYAIGKQKALKQEKKTEGAKEKESTNALNARTEGVAA